MWIDDFFICDHLLEALDEFHIAGVAGNARRAPNQLAWLFLDTRWTRDDGNLRGGVAHSKAPLGHVDLFGPTPDECELLDGVFLAAKASTLR